MQLFKAPSGDFSIIHLSSLPICSFVQVIKLTNLFILPVLVFVSIPDLGHNQLKHMCGHLLIYVFNLTGPVLVGPNGNRY